MATSIVCEFGRPATDFTLRGTDRQGRVRDDWRLGELRGPNGTVVMFLCNHCPYVKAVIGRLVRDMDELASHGIGAVAIMPNDTAAYPEDSFENMQAFAERHRFGFPYLIDETQTVAKAYGAVCTPEFFGFDRDLRLQYHGRLDSAGIHGAGGPERRDLFEAMLAVARGGEGPREQVASLGCSIKWR